MFQELTWDASCNDGRSIPRVGCLKLRGTPWDFRPELSFGKCLRVFPPKKNKTGGLSFASQTILLGRVFPPGEAKQLEELDRNLAKETDWEVERISNL